MMLEYESVLSRPENLSAFGLTTDEVERFLDSMALLIPPIFWPSSRRQGRARPLRAMNCL